MFSSVSKQCRDTRLRKRHVILFSDLLLRFLLIMLMTELQKEEERKELMIIPDEPTVAEYYDLRQQFELMSDDFRAVIAHPSYTLPFLQPGRLVKIKHENLEFGWGIILNYQKRQPPKAIHFAPLSLSCC